MNIVLAGELPLSKFDGRESLWVKNMKNKNYCTVGTVSRSIRKKNGETGRIGSHQHIYAWPLTLLAWYRHFNKKLLG